MQMNFPGRGFGKLEHYRQTDIQTNTQTDATESISTPHSQVVTIALNYSYYSHQYYC